MNPAKTQGTDPGVTIRFSTPLRTAPTNPPSRPDDLTFADLPREAGAQLPAPGVHVIEGTVNGFPFRAALTRNTTDCLSIPVNPGLKAAAGADVGEVVRVEITRIADEPECRVPADLIDALSQVPTARALWSQITPLARRDWILWISSAKQPGTRQGRITKACSMLADGKRRVCCFGGLRWLVKDHPSAGETWADLPREAANLRPPSPSPPRPGETANRARAGG